MRAIDTSCTIEIEQTSDYFHAHVSLDADIAIQPGDKVRVHGDPISVAFGQKLVERRRATVERAGWLTRAWTRVAGLAEFEHLYDVSFTPGRTP